MRRYQAQCRHCNFVSAWNSIFEKSEQEIKAHLHQVHHLAAVAETADYHLAQERQCDYCLEAYLDDCTKCRRDFCRLHAGDIDGLCGGCI